MASLFKTPKPKPLPALPRMADPEAEERRLRIESLIRRRRGRAGTILTSPRGLFQSTPWQPRRKSLLGE